MGTWGSTAALRTGEGLAEGAWGPAQKRAEELVGKGRSPLGRGNHCLRVRRGRGGTGEERPGGRAPRQALGCGLSPAV